MFALTDEVSQIIAIGCVASVMPWLALTAAGILLRQLRAWGWEDDK